MAYLNCRRLHLHITYTPIIFFDLPNVEICLFQDQNYQIPSLTMVDVIFYLNQKE